jgi:hypothetical protein
MVDIKICASLDDLRASLTPISHYFGRQPVDEQIKTLQRVLPAHRVHAAWDEGRVVGAAGSYAFELTVPGGHVPTAGVTIVAVLPTRARCPIPSGAVAMPANLRVPCLNSMAFLLPMPSTV